MLSWFGNKLAEVYEKHRVSCELPPSDDMEPDSIAKVFLEGMIFHQSVPEKDQKQGLLAIINGTDTFSRGIRLWADQEFSRILEVEGNLRAQLAN